MKTSLCAVLTAICFLSGCKSLSGGDPGGSYWCDEKWDAIYREVLDSSPARIVPDAPIASVRAYPPVWGPYAYNGIALREKMTPDSNWYIPTGPYVPLWIAPVGYNPAMPNAPGPEENSSDRDTLSLTPLPKDISTVQVITIHVFKAHIRIYDSRSKLIRELDQNFGNLGEFNNQYRITSAGMASFLVWDTKDEKGNFVGDGAYTWRITFAMSDGNVVEKALKTGVFKSYCPS